MQIVNPLTAFSWTEPLEIHGIRMRGIAEKQGHSFSRHGWLAAKEDSTIDADKLGAALRRQLRPLSAPSLQKTRQEYAARQVPEMPRYLIFEPVGGVCGRRCPF